MATRARLGKALFDYVNGPKLKGVRTFLPTSDPACVLQIFMKGYCYVGVDLRWSMNFSYTRKVITNKKNSL